MTDQAGRVVRIRDAGRRRVTAALDRQRRLEAWVEGRWPRIYDSRHAAKGVGRLVWPIVGPVIVALLLALVVLPILALLAGLLAVLHLAGVGLPRLPDVDLPGLPDLPLPGWLRSILDAVGDVVASVASAIGDVVALLQWPALAVLVLAGLHQSRSAMRRRAGAEALGRPELHRRLAITLAGLEEQARRTGAERIGALGRPDLRDQLSGVVEEPARDRRPNEGG